MAEFTAAELPTLQQFLQRRFGKDGFALKMRERAKDSVEVHLDNEFIGVIYKDEEGGETSYDFNMAILAEDL